MKRIVPLLILLLCLTGCSRKEELTCSFADTDYSKVAVIQLQNAHTGAYTYVQDREDVDAILEFMHAVSGKGGHSAKGYYEGTWGLEFLDEDWQEIDGLSLGFGDSDVFFYGAFGDGYPVRYNLDGLTKEDVVSFFQDFEG